MSKKRIVFLILCLLTFPSCDLQASNYAQAMYWDTLPEPQKNVVRQYNGFLLKFNNEFNMVPSTILCALYGSEDLEKIRGQEDNTILKMMNELYAPLNEILLKAGLPSQAESHISKVFLNTHAKLVALLTPLQGDYDQIRKKETITQEDAMYLQNKAMDIATQISNAFPTEIRVIRKHIFPGYLGEKAPLNPELTTLLSKIETEMDERRGLDHHETVMVHGNILAQQFFPQIIALLPELINIDMTAAQLPSYVGLKEWIETIEDSDLKNSLIKQMDEKSNLKRTNVEEAFHNSGLSAGYSVSGLNSGLVWKSTAHVVRTIYDQYGRTEPDAKTLLFTYFLKLNEQNGTCTTGGIGRNFQVLTQAYKFLIELKSRSTD